MRRARGREIPIECQRVCDAPLGPDGEAHGVCEREVLAVLGLQPVGHVRAAFCVDRERPVGDAV